MYVSQCLSGFLLYMNHIESKENTGHYTINYITQHNRFIMMGFDIIHKSKKQIQAVQDTIRITHALQVHNDRSSKGNE